MLKTENYELVLNGETVRVIVEPMTNDYRILLQGKKVGKLWRRKQGSFACKCLHSGQIFGGVTRREATNSMIYGSFKKSHRT